MEIQIFILSTMSPESTAANLNIIDIDFDKTKGTIQRFRLDRKKTSAISVSLWIGCQHPLTNILLESTIPYMDACICLYHDNDPLSCLRVRTAIQLLEVYCDNIWLMVTNKPILRIRHESKIRKFFDRNGFLRPLLVGENIQENIEKILNVDLNVSKYLS
jgi:hypothetical protein